MSSSSENGDSVPLKEQAISTALTNLDINKQDTQNSNVEAKDSADLTNDKIEGCAHCKRSNPTKRCAKRHAKCITKLFCDSTCESAAHKKKIAVAAPETNENLEHSSNTAIVTKTKTELAAEKKEKSGQKSKKETKPGHNSLFRRVLVSPMILNKIGTLDNVS
jgi:hypothetical protein